MASLYGLEGLGLGFHTEPSKRSLCVVFTIEFWDQKGTF